MCSLGIEPTTFRSADAMFYHWATQEHCVYIIHIKYIISYFKNNDERVKCRKEVIYYSDLLFNIWLIINTML